MITRSRILGAVLSGLLMYSLGASVYAEDTDTPMPDSFKEKTKGISEEKLEILDSPLPTMLLGTMERFYKSMEGKSAEDIEAYLDGMIEVAEAGKFNPETDMASIPLNTEAKGFNGWKAKRPKSLNPEREPGPIHLSRYMSSRSGGVKTFANAPLAIYPEDLIAGNVDIAIVGAPLDMGSYYRGQKFGPQAMRNEYGAGGIDMSTMVNPSKVLSIVDYGDIAIDTDGRQQLAGSPGQPQGLGLRQDGRPRRLY